MRRKRPSGASPEADDNTLRLVDTSNNHAVTSPRSPLSQGTLDSFDVHSPLGNGSTAASGSISIVGSVIGHDDPTLVHTNIVKSPRNGGVGIIRSYGTIDSFLTEYNSDLAATESRESPTRRPRNLSDRELREQLSELDRAQAQWQEQQMEQGQNVAVGDMDSTGDFYVNEAGGNFRLLPNHKRPTSLSLYEQTILEEESCDEILEDSSRDRHFDHPHHDDEEDEDDNNYGSNINNNDDDDHDADDEKDKDISNRGGIVGSAPTDSASVASSIASSVQTNEADSAGSDLVYEYPSTSNSSEQIAARNKGVGLMSPSRDENDQPVEGVAHLRSIERVEPPAETDEIVKQVQKRLYDLSYNATSTTSPIGRERTEPPSDQRRAGFRSWIPVGDEASVKIIRGGLATQSDLSEGEDDVRRKAPIRRRRRLFCLNVCLVLFILGAIICSVLFAVDMIGSDSSASVVAPTLPPTTSTENPAMSPVQSPTVGSTPSAEPPTNSPSQVVQPTSETPTTASPTATLPDPVPTTISRPVDERLVAISGDAINEPGTPQYQAYDWLVNSDPANLDLETISDLDLEQRYISALFYFSLGGVNWIDQFGFLEESNVCQWNVGFNKSVSGVICDDNGVINGFAINDNNLRGQLPVELQELTGTKVLQLRTNSILGTLSPGLGLLSDLQELDLRENQLVGTIPEGLFALTKMRQMLLHRNTQLGGTIPESIGTATNLELLSFQRCQISGTLPESIGNLTSLYFFTLKDNKLTGSIPEGLTILPKLEVMELAGNKLTGTIPSFARQTALYFVALFDNMLSGTIPPSLGELEGLLFLDVHDNQLVGPVPSTLGSLPELVTLFAQNNMLTGELPSFSANKGLLQAVNLAQNRLSGSVDDFFSTGGPTSRLFSVDLSENQLNGTLPPDIGEYSELTDLLLDGNAFTGSIPIEIGFLRELDTLNVRGNNLNGTIPEEVGFLGDLRFLDLANNQLVGTIPDTLIMLSHLTTLDLSSNGLEGTVPSTFGQLTLLEELYLNNNDLVGDLTSTFCPTASSTSSPPINVFVADCLGTTPQVTCDCCTSCCDDTGCMTN